MVMFSGMSGQEAQRKLALLKGMLPFDVFPTLPCLESNGWSSSSHIEPSQRLEMEAVC